LVLCENIVWIEVRDADLSLHVDTVSFVGAKLAPRGLAEAAVFLTSREIRRHHLAQSCVNAAAVTCLTSVGLSNGEKVGARQQLAAKVAGTINTLVHDLRPLSDGAFVEAVSIAMEARTATIMETNALRGGPPITGTGTDCILVAAHAEGAPEACAGLHNDLGDAIGAAVYEATLAGAKEWSAECRLSV
jgi:adenosylcobinamide amidohydrolase